MLLSDLERRIVPYASIAEWRGKSPRFIFVSDGDHKDQLGLFAGTLGLITSSDALRCEGDQGSMRYSQGDIVLDSQDSSRILYSDNQDKAGASWAPLDVSPQKFKVLLTQGSDIGFNDSLELLAKQSDVERRLRIERVKATYRQPNREGELLEQAYLLTAQRSDVMIADLLSE